MHKCCVSMPQPAPLISERIIFWIFTFSRARLNKQDSLLKKTKLETVFLEHIATNYRFITQCKHWLFTWGFFTIWSKQIIGINGIPWRFFLLVSIWFVINRLNSGDLERQATSHYMSELGLFSLVYYTYSMIILQN
jgi:hypothetical protein